MTIKQKEICDLIFDILKDKKDGDVFYDKTCELLYKKGYKEHEITIAIKDLRDFGLLRNDTYTFMQLTSKGEKYIRKGINYFFKIQRIKSTIDSVVKYIAIPTLFIALFSGIISYCNYKTNNKRNKDYYNKQQVDSIAYILSKSNTKNTQKIDSVSYIIKNRLKSESIDLKIKSKNK